MEELILNSHNKAEYEPAHTCEHILNQTMARMFGCPRSRNAHIERKKSKCDYILDSCPTDEQVKAIEDKVNEVISSNIDVTIRFSEIGEFKILSHDFNDGIWRLRWKVISKE